MARVTRKQLAIRVKWQVKHDTAYGGKYFYLDPNPDRHDASREWFRVRHTREGEKPTRADRWKRWTIDGYDSQLTQLRSFFFATSKEAREWVEERIMGTNIHGVDPVRVIITNAASGQGSRGAAQSAPPTVNPEPQKEALVCDSVFQLMGAGSGD